MTDYLTLEEADAGRRTVYEAAPVTREAMRTVFEDMAKLIGAGEKSLTAALDKAGDNTDNGAHFLCRYQLRNACGERLAIAAGKLPEGERKPLTVVRAALERLVTQAWAQADKAA